jgi:uncharacterized membrane protein HdeD (DUF308 family)
MASPLTVDARRATTWSIVLSVLLMIAGLIAIALPMIAGVAITVIVGWLLLFAGILHLIFAWSAGRPSTVVWQILLGVVYGFIGFYVLVNPVAGLAGLTFAIALYLLIEGVLEFLLSFQLRPAAGSGWLLFDAIVTVILAILIWSSWPLSATWAIGLLVGISMFFSGMTRLMLSLAVRRVTA